ncbi:MAG: hypothetical protein ABL886_00750 [Rhodoglobus sp.]
MENTIDTAEVRLTRGAVDAVVLPREGAVLTRLRVGGRSVLATTPWPHGSGPHDAPARSEVEWVARWRGGWQLCFPSAGAVDAVSEWPQGFHGVASQAAWRVVAVHKGRVVLEWQDEHALTARRTWELTDSGARVDTVVRNGSTVTRPLVIAEHLVLGGDLLAPEVRAAGVSIRPPSGALLAPLDYTGRPDGSAVPWPGAIVDRWPHLDGDTPARVAALVGVEPRNIRIDSRRARATVSWNGLPHALLWEELAQSTEPPWNGSVVALGIEPTSAPHGMGTAIQNGTIQLAPGASHTWSVALAVEWASDRESDAPDRDQETS